MLYSGLSGTEWTGQYTRLPVRAVLNLSDQFGQATVMEGLVITTQDLALVCKGNVTLGRSSLCATADHCR